MSQSPWSSWRRRAAGGIVAVALLGGPSLAIAQPDAVLQAVRELAILASQPAGQRSVAGVADRLAAAVRDWDRQIAALQDRVDRDGQSVSAPGAYQMHLELALAYRGRGRSNDAVRELDAAAALKPGGSDLQLLRALTLEAAGKRQDAANSFQRAWRFDSRNPLKAYYVLERGAGSADDRRAAHALLDDTYARLAAGDAVTVSPLLTSALVPDALWRTPVVADDALREAFALLSANKFSEAAVALKRAPATPRAGVSGEIASPLTHFQRGKSHEEANRVADARREYQAALTGTLVGRHVLYVALGRLALVDGDQAGAVDAFTKAVELAPNDPSIHRELAGALAAEGQVDEAFRELVAALLIDPHDPQAYAAIGQLRLDAGADQDAVVAFTRALVLTPDRYEPRWGLATALTRLGKSDEAARQLELFERARREADERRRRAVATESEQQESIWRGVLEK